MRLILAFANMICFKWIAEIVLGPYWDGTASQPTVHLLVVIGAGLLALANLYDFMREAAKL